LDISVEKEKQDTKKAYKTPVVLPEPSESESESD